MFKKAFNSCLKPFLFYGIHNFHNLFRKSAIFPDFIVLFSVTLLELKNLRQTFIKQS